MAHSLLVKKSFSQTNCESYVGKLPIRNTYQKHNCWRSFFVADFAVSFRNSNVICTNDESFKNSHTPYRTRGCKMYIAHAVATVQCIRRISLISHSNLVAATPIYRSTNDTFRTLLNFASNAKCNNRFERLQKPCLPSKCCYSNH